MRKQKHITYEQAAEILTELSAMRQELAQAKRSGRSANLLGAVVATSTPRVDGKITLADVVVSLSMTAGFVGAGIFAGTGTVLITGDFDIFPTICGGFTVAGSGLAALRLAGDALNLAGFWNATFGAWLDARYPEIEPGAIEHRATVRMPESGTSTTHYLGLAGEELDTAVLFAREYLELMRQNVDNPTAEKHWVGGGKMWAGSKAGREAWDDFKFYWISRQRPKLAKVTDKRGAWKFTPAGREVLKSFATLPIEID